MPSPPVVAALSAVAGELADALPKIGACKAANPVLLRAKAAAVRKVGQTRVAGELDAAQEEALLKEARTTILAARSLLA